MIDPISRYQSWFDEVLAAGGTDPKAACLCTVGADGRPGARMVLVQYATARGLHFFTNLGSRKGRELVAHPTAALTFHWPQLERQVRVEGGVVRVDDDEADRYFATRPRESQIGAWASLQSEVLASREALEVRVRDAAERFAGVEVPRPPFWSGFVLVPDRVEFWTGMAGRLHHRELFERDHPGEPWRACLLFP